MGEYDTKPATKANLTNTKAAPRKPPPAPKMAPKPVQSTDVKPTSAQEATPKAAEEDVPAASSTLLTVTARYDNLPGASKSGPGVADGHTGLWFDPLTFAPSSPHAAETTDRVGVTKGGSQVVARFETPLHQAGEAAGSGTGSIAAQLKYTRHMETSYTVKLEGRFASGDEQRANKVLKDWVAEKLQHTGDLEAIQQLAVQHLAALYPAAQNLSVHIAPRQAKGIFEDGGKSHIFYKARTNPVVALSVPVVAVADRTITSGATRFQSRGEEADRENHQTRETDQLRVTDDRSEDVRSKATATQTFSEEWRRARKQTFDEIMSTLESTVSSLTSDLVRQAKADSTYHDKDHSISSDLTLKTTDYTKNVKGGTESGVREDKNGWAWLEDVFKGVGGLLDLPFLKDSKWLRRLNGWELVLDAGKTAAGLLAVRGKVNYTDSHEDTTANGSTTGTNLGSVNRDRTVTRKDDETLKRDLTETFRKAVHQVKATHASDLLTDEVSKSGKATQDAASKFTKADHADHRSDRTRTTEGAASHIKANQAISATLEYTVTATETTSRPVLQATIVDGDGEISSTEFPAPGARKPE